MKNFNILSVEVLSNEELASVKGGYGIPVPIIIEEFSAGYGIPVPIIIEE
jgi:bacteriocin-like protein